MANVSTEEVASITDVVKRLVDVLGAVIGLVVLAPVLAVLALLVRLRLGSPIFFRQRRPGLDGRPFTILKFRTMTEERDEPGRLLPASDRLTDFGRTLRSTSLDELPELVNVLRGDMSLVGPRPLRLEYLDHYSPRQARRHEVRPGITGVAQISGRNTLAWSDRLELDVWYVDNRSLRLDLLVLLQTLWITLRREGVHSAEGGIIEPFEGTGPGSEPGGRGD